MRVQPAPLRAVRDYMEERSIQYREVGALVSVTGFNGVKADLSGVKDIEGVRISTRPGNLEDVFLAITGRELRDE